MEVEEEQPAKRQLAEAEVGLRTGPTVAAAATAVVVTVVAAAAVATTAAAVVVVATVGLAASRHSFDFHQPAYAFE